LAEADIIQRGERWRDVASPFQILDVPHLRGLRAKPGSLISSHPTTPATQGTLCQAALRGGRLAAV
jgi:hypothetical protein